MPRKPAVVIIITVFWVILACAFFADGQKYKASFALGLAGVFLLVGMWPKVKARFRTGSPDT